MKPDSPLTADELRGLNAAYEAAHDGETLMPALRQTQWIRTISAGFPRMLATIVALRTQLEQAQKGLEEIERIVTTTGGPQLHMILKIRDAIARALSGEGSNQ
jgi:hypothetical protein